MFTRELSQLLRHSLGYWKLVGYSQWIREVAGEYMWIEGSRDS